MTSLNADRPNRAETRRIAHVVVCGPHQIPCVAFLHELRDRTRGGQRNIIRVRLNREQYLSTMRRALSWPLEKRLS